MEKEREVPTYINKNIGGLWFSIPVSKATLKKAKTKTYENNLAIMDKLKQTMPDDKYTEGERIAMFNQLSQHVHYRVDNMVDDAIETGQIDDRNIKPV